VFSGKFSLTQYHFHNNQNTITQGKRMPKQKKKKLLDEVSDVMRVKHYSIHTERSYCEWIKRFVLFHGLQEREELFVESEEKIELFLTDLAVNGNIAPSTQNQARML
jgi:hypothetical protein